MNRFNEKYLHSIDQKGRLQLSRDTRIGIELNKGDIVHLLPNPKNPPFLEIRTSEQWDGYWNRISKQPLSKEIRDFKRFVVLMHEKVTADNQGRIVIPQRLREFCGFDKEVGVINMESHLEVWDKEFVEQKYNDMLRAFNDISDELF